MVELSWQSILTVMAVLLSAYFYFKHKYNYFASRGIKTPPIIWPLGNVHQQVFYNVHSYMLEQGQKLGKLWGLYVFTTPSIVISDPELVKQVLIKDFHHFVNRVDFNAIHEMWDKNLFSSKDDAWKRIRTIASPSFTSGKLRGMSSIMRTNIAKLERYFERVTTNENAIDTKKVFAGFTIDVIASAAFATETDANADDNATHPLVSNGRRLFDIQPMRVLATVLPKWFRQAIGFETFFEPSAFNYFIDLTRHIVAQRRSAMKIAQNLYKNQRNDIVQMLIDACVDEKDLVNMNYEKMTADEMGQDKNEKTSERSVSTKQKLTDTEIIANCVFFFIAGYESTGATFTHTIYELAMNQDVQDRLSQDLHESLDQLDEDSEEYFDKVMNGIPYLEAVVKETLRRYPPVSALSRTCNADSYKLNDQITLHKDQLVQISVPSMHLNPEYYPEPERYIPDRFMPENKHLLIPYTFLPFSVGPRNCIAMRFAYQEIKLCLAAIVRKYHFHRTADTPDKLKFKPGLPLLNCHPFTVRVTKRVQV